MTLKTLLVLFFFLSPFANAAARRFGEKQTITAKMLTFTYETFDAGETMTCTHEIVNPASQDWRVRCRTADGTQTRTYGVHLWVTAYPHSASDTKLSYEVLYWVTDNSAPMTAPSSGSTIWFHLKDATALAGVDVSQSVDNDMAGLYLKLDFRKGVKSP